MKRGNTLYLSLIVFFIQQYTIAQKGSPSLQESLNWITEKIGDVEVGKSSVQQKFSYENDDPCRIRLESKGSELIRKKQIDRTFELNLKDVDENAIEFKVNGKRIMIQLKSINRQKLFKTYKNGEVGNYTSQIQIFVNDVESGRDLVDALKHSVSLCQDIKKDWYDK